jgi:hypothetical protein
MGYEFLVISSYTAAVLDLGITAARFSPGVPLGHRWCTPADGTAFSLGMTPASAMSYIICRRRARGGAADRQLRGLLRDRVVLDYRRAGLMLRARTWRRRRSCRAHSCSPRCSTS